VKTISLKKVSAVAVASLGFGLLSVVPAQAADIGSFIISKNAAASGVVKCAQTLTLSGTPLTTITAGATSACLTNANTPVGKGVWTHLNYLGTIASITTDTTVGVVSAATTLTTAAANYYTGVVATTVVKSGVDANAITGMTVAAGAAAGIHLVGNGTDVAAVTDTARILVNGIQIGATTQVTRATDTGLFLPFTAPVTAGTYVATVQHSVAGTYTGTGADTQTQNFTLTVTANAGYSNSLSTGFIVYGNGTTADATTSAAQNSVSATKSTANRAAINVVINDTLGVAFTSGASLSAEISGPGFLKWANQAVTATQCVEAPQYGTDIGRSLAARAVDAQSALYVCADGTAGVSTVTLKITDQADAVTTLATRTVTFSGAVATIAATGVLTIAKSGGAVLGASDANRTTAANTPAIIVKATDSAGNGVSGLTFTALSSAPAILQSSITCTEDIKSSANVLSSGGVGFYNCLVTSASGAASGNTAALTVRTVSPADATAFLTSVVNYTIGGTAATGTETLSFDKTSYAPGEAMVITRTAKDSAGNPVHDLLASPAVTFSKAPGGTPPAISAYVGGKSASSTSATTATVFAPVTPGSFIATATAANGATITATATVTDANAALMTQIDALNAKIVALNALIAKIMKKLGVK
jgi:hypothetical protein